MIDGSKLKYISDRLSRCQEILDAESRLIKGANDSYGIEFDNQQTFKINVKPIFDMDDEKIVALLELMAHGVPMIPDLIAEINSLEAGIKALIEAIATIAIIASRQNHDDITSKDNEKNTEGKAPTIGEK